MDFFMNFQTVEDIFILMSNLDVYWRSFFKGDSITLARALIQDNLEKFLRKINAETP